MKKYTVLKISVIAGIFCAIDQTIELKEKDAKKYIDEGFIKELTEEKEEILSPDVIEAMTYAELKAKVAELEIVTPDLKMESLKAALLEHIGV
ncbi:hypothetical protein BN3087_220046 [Sulfurovum sp. enrichment culture clone C5]|uniref:Uncharacterized protein n=1 Tax=Sulfurovum sp. enrichment culture clone C5 TaxID=497650 RepID=A0A0S4XLV9_9BACT|nr:hypothetical protein BN3087_220046 [Sulfurovum sp. enrichment culture clone C5]